jgi:mannose-1-phosphate guanylyltransferase / phosphomannomutase
MTSHALPKGAAMKAVVMAGGEGSRLRPLTLTRPKPMLPVVNRPLLGHILYLLKQHGISDVVITLQYLANQIQDYFGDGKSLDMSIEYVIEDSPLGTAGSVKNAAPYLPDDESFLVISGDALTNFDLTAIVNYHRERGGLVTVALYHVPDPLDYGVVNTDAEGRITQFLEKPGWGEVTSDTVNTGIYVIEPSVLARIPAGQSVDWSHEVFPDMITRDQRLLGYVADGYWCDVGTLGEYHRGNADLLNGRLHLGELGGHIGGGIWTGGPVEIAPDAQLFGPIYLGEEVKIKGSVVIHGPAVVGDYTILDNRVRVDRTVIWRNCYIGEGVELHGSVIGQQCSLKSRSVAFEGSVIADRTVIGEDAVIQPAVKIWPNKEIDAGATVNHSIIWGSQGKRVLFGRYGVTGVVNVDLTPDFVARLGAAFGSVLPKGSIVTINRDPHRSPRMLKRALIAGLPSAGNNVLDLRNVPIPVARYYTRAVGAAGGLHVRLSPYDQRVVDIRFIDHNGLNLTRDQERAIERVFYREDFRRAYMEDIGNIDYALDVVEVYARGYLNSINVRAIRDAHFKIVADYAHAPAADVLPDLLEHLNVEVVPLNARIDANKMALTPDEFMSERAQFATITGALKDTSLGVRLDIGGEKIFVADDTGTAVPDAVMCAAMAALVFRTHPGSSVVVTTDQSHVVERLAERYGGHVLRCQVDVQAMMEAATGEGVLMAGDGTGNFIFPALHPAIDGLIALGKLLELLALQHTTLSQVVAELPEFFVASQQVDSNWDSKGRVMRCLMEQFARFTIDTTDGVKVYLDEREWVLIRPDADRALFHIVAEARSAEAVNGIVAKYSRLVGDLSQMPCPTNGSHDTQDMGIITPS